MKIARLHALKKALLTLLALGNVILLFQRAIESTERTSLLTLTTKSNLPAAERGNPR